MSRRKSIFQRWMKECETRDDHYDPELRSHYYKQSYKNVLQAVIGLFEGRNDMEVASVSEERGEIAIHMTRWPKAFIVATVIQVRPREISVDFMVSTEAFNPFGMYPKLRKLVLGFYGQLDQQLPVSGQK
jgi:hypothetical protein